MTARLRRAFPASGEVRAEWRVVGRHSRRKSPLAVGALVAAALAVLCAPPAAAAPGPPDAPEYWFDQWQVPQLWAAGARGQGVTIAEIDTGVAANLPELAGSVLRGTDFGSDGGDGRTDRDQSDFGHGTAMASLMVARPGTLDVTGLAPDAKILPVAVPLTGTSDESSNDHLAEAIRWSADHGAKIISMSLGGTRIPSRVGRACPSGEQRAIYHALAKGAVLFAASGNRGNRDNAVEEPGVCLGVVSVGAVDRFGRVADFSSRHRYLTMTAPGVDVASLGRVAGTAYDGNGTSQATALASAAAALVWSRYPALTGRRLVARLLATLDERRASRDPAYGFGVLDAERAVTEDVPASAPDPVYADAAPFLARYRAARAAKHRAATRPPAPVKAPARPGGGFAVGDLPRPGHGQVVAGIVVAGLGALALVALLLGAAVARHRRIAGWTVDAGGRARSTAFPDPFAPERDPPPDLTWRAPE